MTQTIPAKDINIRYLIDNFGLQKNQDQDFFREWQDNLPKNKGLKPLMSKEKKAVVCGAFRRMGWRGLPLFQSRERNSSRSAKRHIQSTKRRKKFPF
ncbi:MAG: hypothetical protein F6K08_28715 [Okeania sp. SIO1H6]|nr:hypothetical protein [Okeania sp. SIO1H6]